MGTTTPHHSTRTHRRCPGFGTAGGGCGTSARISSFRAPLTKPAQLLTRWATEQDWSDSGFVVSDTAWGGLAEVFGWFESATSLYRLVDPGTAHEHNYGFVIGACGFHEFVAIDRANHLVRLVVATDD